MGYSYSPQSSDERARALFSNKGKHLAIAAAIILFVGTFFFVGNTMTGYVTYSKNLELELNRTSSKLVGMNEKYELCDSSLQMANEGIASLNNSMNACSTELFSQKLLVSSCNSEKNALSQEKNNISLSLSRCRSEQSASTDSYKQLARNSVKAICCSFGDMQSASVRAWNVTNNSIVCSGSYTINCTSGETNY